MEQDDSIPENVSPIEDKQDEDVEQPTHEEQAEPESEPEVVQVQDNEQEPEAAPYEDQDDVKQAPLAEQERSSGLNVPPPSPNEGSTADDTQLLIENDDQPEVRVEDVPTPEREDEVFIETELEPQMQSTPIKEKPVKQKKEKKKKEKKEKKPKEPKPPKEPKEPKEPVEPKKPKEPKVKKERKPLCNFNIPRIYKSALVKLLCGLYALVIVVLGLVFATATALTSREREHQYYLEIFLTYLYFGSLLVLLYFQIGLLRGVKVKNSYFDTNIKVSVRPDGSIQKSPSATPMPQRAHELNDDVTLENGRAAEEISLASRHSQLVLPVDGGVAHVGEGINFYLRLGALAFAFGSVTLDGLHIASYFETPDTKTCNSDIFILVYVMHLVFTFVQTFFLFKNHKLVIDKQKAMVRFGMMHIMATNLCVLIVTAVRETAEDYRQQDFMEKNQTINWPVKSCYEEITLARSASPFLFPCTIIYSIIAAGIVYRLYQYIGAKVKQRWPSHTSLTSSVPQGATGIDCDKANKGLFLGLLVGVATLIAIATFFVFENRISDPNTAVKIFYVTEMALMVVTAIGIVWGLKRLTTLKFLQACFFSVDSVLLIVALSGTYIYLFFILISVLAGGMLTSALGIFSIVSIVLALVQITMQIVFILDGLCRCAENDTQMFEKPGRSVVTFLLVCNLAMWVVSMFEIKKTQVVPIHENFYGILAWNIITHMCVPCLIFFRFHSAICLSKIWYNAYQKEKTT